MGYYDDLYQTERKKDKQRGNGKIILTSLTSAIVGGLVVLLMVPTLTQSGYLPNITQQSAATAVLDANTNTKANDSLSSVVKPISISVDNATVEAVSKVENAVVGISNVRQGTDFWGTTGTATSGEGSGVIYKKEGNKAFIITNNHVIEGAERLEVSLPGGDKVQAKIVGKDQLTDLAVLEIDASKVKATAELGDSSTLRVGEPVIAIGNPLGQKFSRTVTQGIISSLERSMPMDTDNDNQTDWELDVLQTDAAINPGNSGGALVNLYGQVIGINTLKISREGVEGLGFAIPINDVRKIVESIEKDGYLKRSYMGITPYDLTRVPQYMWKEELNLPDSVKSGVVVAEVGAVTPSEKAGLRQYDVIVKLDDKEITNSAQLHKFLTLNKQPGEEVKVTYYRAGFKKETNVKLGTRPKQ